METNKNISIMKNETYNLGYATINFETETIVWEAGQFTPKRRQLILSYFEKGYIDYYHKQK